MSIIDNERVFAATEIGTLYHDDDRSIVEKYGQMCAPYFKIEISDKDDNRLFSADTLVNNGGFDLNGLIIDSVIYEEDIDGAAVVNLVVNNPTLELINSDLFKEGNNIDIWMGYDGHTPFYMNRGIIVDIAPELPADSMPTIKLIAYDIAYFMMEEGKGEIVPEGSSWWERSRIVSTAPQTTTTTYNNAFPDFDPTVEEEANIERENEVAQGQGQQVMQRTEGFDTAREGGWAPSQTEIESGQIVEPGNEAAPQRQTRMGWQQQRFGRRRRNSGKVWKNLTDAEIVAKIFLSYGVTPYVEATREHVRRGRARNRPSTGTTSTTGSVTGVPRNPNRIGMDELTVEDFNLTEAQQNRLEAAQRDDESLDETRERLGTDITEYVETGDEVGLSYGQEELTQAESFDTLNNSRYMLTDANADAAALPMIDGPAFRYNSGFEANDYAYYDDYVMRVRDDTPPQQPTRATGDRNVTQKSGTTDWQFIKELADKHGFIVFVFFHIESRRWIGYWGPEDKVPQFREYIFRYNAGDLTTLGNVKPNASTKNQSSEIDLIYVDPVSRKENRLRVSMDNISNYTSEFRGDNGPNTVNNPIGDGPEVVLAVHGQRVRVNANHRFTSAEDARIWLMSFWMAHANDFALLEGNTIVGIPEMRAREHHQFEGMLRYSGKYFVTQSRHKMDPNTMYQTEFTARKVTQFGPGDENTELMTVDQSDLGTHNADTTEKEIIL